MLVKQAVKHSEELHHSLITARTWGQRGLHQKVFLRAIVAHQSESPMAAAMAPNNWDIRSNPVQLHCMVRGYLLRDKSREQHNDECQLFGLSLKPPVKGFIIFRREQCPAALGCFLYKMSQTQTIKNLLRIRCMT